MADISVITRIRTREDGSTLKWPVLVFLHCETEDGDVMLRMTGEAAHELKALLEKLPARIGKRQTHTN